MLASILALLAFIASAQTSLALRFDQRNAANTGYNSKFVAPSANDPCVNYLPSAAAGATPGCLILGSSFQISSGILNVPVTVGEQGPVGPQGPQGAQGPAGNDGAAGAVGSAGAPGETGPQGPAGPAGAQGPIGPQGPAGATGANGAQGIQGIQGITGATGATGPTGAPGAKGDVGETGSQGPAGAAAPTFNFGAPATRALAVSTTYQASDTGKASIVTISPSCSATLTLTAGGTCTLQARIASSAPTCSAGTIVATWTNGNTGALTIGLGLTQTIGSPGDIKLPIGWYFILCPTAGTFTISAVDQTAG